MTYNQVFEIYIFKHRNTFKDTECQLISKIIQFVFCSDHLHLYIIVFLKKKYVLLIHIFSFSRFLLNFPFVSKTVSLPHLSYFYFVSHHKWFIQAAVFNGKCLFVFVFFFFLYRETEKQSVCVCVRAREMVCIYTKGALLISQSILRPTLHANIKGFFFYYTHVKTTIVKIQALGRYLLTNILLVIIRLCQTLTIRVLFYEYTIKCMYE